MRSRLASGERREWPHAESVPGTPRERPRPRVGSARVLVDRRPRGHRRHHARLPRRRRVRSSCRCCASHGSWAGTSSARRPRPSSSPARSTRPRTPSTCSPRCRVDCLQGLAVRDAWGWEPRPSGNRRCDGGRLLLRACAGPTARSCRVPSSSTTCAGANARRWRSTTTCCRDWSWQDGARARPAGHGGCRPRHLDRPRRAASSRACSTPRTTPVAAGLLRTRPADLDPAASSSAGPGSAHAARRDTRERPAPCRHRRRHPGHPAPTRGWPWRWTAGSGSSARRRTGGEGIDVRHGATSPTW